MSSTPVNQDPALAPPPPAAAPPAGAPAADPAAPPHLLDSAQIVQLLRHFPNVYQVGLISLPFPPFPPSSFRLHGVRVYQWKQRGIVPIGSSCARSHVIRGEGHGWGTFACQSGADDRQVVVAHVHLSQCMCGCSQCRPVPFKNYFLMVLLSC